MNSKMLSLNNELYIFQPIMGIFYLIFNCHINFEDFPGVAKTRFRLCYMVYFGNYVPVGQNSDISSC